MNCLLIWTLFAGLTSGTRLLKRELSDYDLAKCNDGTPAAYFHDQDVRSAGSRVLIYLPDGGDCSSVEECNNRCAKSSSERAMCTSPEKSVLEKDDGFWSNNPNENPFADYFKVYIHYCSSDDFSGTRGASRSTGNLFFHGKHIITSTLQDLVARFGIDRAESVVLVGSGAGARGVGYNCDFVSESINAVNPRTDVRCVADAPDFVPWWVKTEFDVCQDKDYDQLEVEKFMWGREGDETCDEANEDIVNSTELAHKCGVWSRYWEYIETPFFVIGSQFDPIYFENNLCGPEKDDPQYGAYQLSWRRGMIALFQSMLAKRPNLGLFVPNCDSHTLLSGSLTSAYWSQLEVPILDTEEKGSLTKVLEGWRNSDYKQAIDPIGSKNDQCITPAPQVSGCGRLLGCGGLPAAQTGGCGRLGGCGGRPLFPAGTSVGARRAYIRRLRPPTNLFPATFNKQRRCGLDPYAGGCGGRGGGCNSGGCGGGGGGGSAVGFDTSYLGSGGSGIIPESAIPASGRRGRLWRRYYYMQYLRLLYNKYKKEYAREYYYGGSRYTGTYPEDVYSSGLGGDPSLGNFDTFLSSQPNIFNKLSGRKHPGGKYPGIAAGLDIPASVLARNPNSGRGLAAAGIVGRVPTTVVRGRFPDTLAADYDYYSDYYDYDYLGDDLFARIVKAVKKNKDLKKDERDNKDQTKGILASSVQEDFEFPQELLDSLPALEDFDYEDFESLNEQVESFDKKSKSPKLVNALSKE